MVRFSTEAEASIAQIFFWFLSVFQYDNFITAT